MVPLGIRVPSPAGDRLAEAAVLVGAGWAAVAGGAGTGFGAGTNLLGGSAPDGRFEMIFSASLDPAEYGKSPQSGSFGFAGASSSLSSFAFGVGAGALGGSACSCSPDGEARPKLSVILAAAQQISQGKHHAKNYDEQHEQAD